VIVLSKLKNYEVQKPLTQNNELKGYLEGVEQIAFELKRLRNPKVRNQAIARSGYKCTICDSTFEGIYGELGKSVFVVHHLIPISKGERISTNDKVIVVCANCHQVLHCKGKEPLLIDELREIIIKLRN